MISKREILERVWFQNKLILDLSLKVELLLEYFELELKDGETKKPRLTIAKHQIPQNNRRFEDGRKFERAEIYNEINNHGRTGDMGGLSKTGLLLAANLVKQRR
jgi:hypothetical protein